MRSIEEIDAELAEVDRQIAMRDALGYKMARTKAILDHDTSGLDRVYAALNQAEQNRIAREAQQAFQTSEREATQKFQAGQNDLNRALQKEQMRKNLAIEQANLLKQLQDRYAEWKGIKDLVGESESNKTAARTAVELARKKALESGVDEKDIEAWKIPSLAGNATPAGNETPATDLSKQWTVDYNNAKNDIPKLKTVKEVDAYMKGLTDKYGNDASITKEVNELVKLADGVKKDLRGKAERAARVAGMKKAAKKQRDDKKMKALAREISAMLKDKQPIYIPGYDKYPITAEETLVDGNDAIIRKYGKTPIDTLFFK